MHNRRLPSLLSLAAIPFSAALFGCSNSQRPPAASTVYHLTDAAEPFDWTKEVAEPLGLTGELRDDVYTVTVPRPDVELHIDGMSVPTAAGVFSTFHFYRCSCGKVSVLGEFVCCDYEANDVIDGLRPTNLIRVTGVGPFAIGDKPRLMVVRFHGEGDGPGLSKLIKSALEWTGEYRSKPKIVNEK